MTTAKIIHPSQVKPYVADQSYSSKMLLDDLVAGVEAINVNEGTLRGGGKTGGGVHEENEIYYVVKGEAVLHLDDEVFDIRPGDLIFIPAGVFHSLDNKSATEEFVLLTLWQRAVYNEMWHIRMKAWGKSFKTIDEE